MSTKHCNTCKRDKPLSEFGKDSYKPSGLHYQCGDCERRSKREYYARNREWMLAKNRVNQRKYRVQRNERERLRKINLRATPELIRAQWERIKRKHKQRCYYCGIKHDKLTIDHVIPISKGGDNSLYNIVPACQVCNSKKGDRSLVEWVQA